MKNLTTKEKVDRVCKLGLYAVVKKDDLYTIISPFSDFDGDWRRSAFCKSIKECTNYIGCTALEEWDGFVFIGTWQPPLPEPYKVGDKVRVPERHEEYFRKVGKTSPLGKILTIQKVRAGTADYPEYYGYSYDFVGLYDPINNNNSEYVHIHHQFLEPVLLDSIEIKDTLLEDGKTYVASVKDGITTLTPTS